MSIISQSNIRDIDLNLLVALDVLLDERNVTRAAERLSYSQPAVSGMLKRLRAVFADPLFVRTQRGLLPTYYYMKALFNRPPNVQVHDSVVVSVPPEGAYDVAEFIRSNLEQPFVVTNGVELIPWVEFKMGINWAASERLGEGCEYKKLPSREEFTEAARRYLKVGERVQAARCYEASERLCRSPPGSLPLEEIPVGRTAWGLLISARVRTASRCCTGE